MGVRCVFMGFRSGPGGALVLAILALGCAKSEPRLPERSGSAELAPIGPTEPAGPGPTLARLTGGVGNKVVDSFDQLRAAVVPLGSAIDECYRSTASEGGWRENLMWDLDVSERGTVTRLGPHYAEYWRGDKIVPGTPGPGLAACMGATLQRLVIAPPVRAGWVRLRFEM